MYKKVIIMILIVSMLLVFGGCTGNTTGKVEEIKKNGKIVLGTAADYPPYEFHKLINGKDEIVGFDIEIAKLIAAEIGVELEIVDMKFEGLLPALVTDDIDFIVAGMVADEERSKTVDFSIPYYQAEQKMIVRMDDKDKYKSPEDLVGLKVSAQKTTIQEGIALEKFTGSTYIGLSKITDMILELQNNKVDAVILADPVAKAYVNQNKDLFMADISLGAEDGVSVAVNKGKSELLELIDKTLDKLIKDGTIDKLINEATILAEE